MITIYSLNILNKANIAFNILYNPIGFLFFIYNIAVYAKISLKNSWLYFSKRHAIKAINQHLFGNISTANNRHYKYCMSVYCIVFYYTLYGNRNISTGFPCF